MHHTPKSSCFFGNLVTSRVELPRLIYGKSNKILPSLVLCLVEC